MKNEQVPAVEPTEAAISLLIPFASLTIFLVASITAIAIECVQPSTIHLEHENDSYHVLLSIVKSSIQLVTFLIAAAAGGILSLTGILDDLYQRGKVSGSGLLMCMLGPTLMVVAIVICYVPFL